MLRLIPLAITCAIMFVACGDSKTEVATQSPSPTPLPYPGLTLRVEVGSPQGPEGSIPLTFVVRNPGDDTVTTWGAGGCPGFASFDLTIERDGQEVWKWSRHAVVCAALVPLTVHPGEQETFGHTWNRRDNDDQAVLPGTYTVTGVVTGLTEDSKPDFELKTEPQEFEVS